MLNNKNKKINILGCSIYIIIGSLIIFCITTYFAFKSEIDKKALDLKEFNLNIWHKMIFMFLFTMLLGGIFKKIGNNTPILRNIGGGAILCLLVPSFIFSYKTDSQQWMKFTEIFKENQKFINENSKMGFSEFFVAFLVVGSLLSIDQNALKKTVKKFLPLVIISLFISASVIGLVGYFLNPTENITKTIPELNNKYSFWNTIFFIFIPISCGGITCGIIPLKTIMSQGNGTLAEKFSPIILPSLIMGGIISVIMGGLIKCIFGKSKYSSLNGELEKEIFSENKNINTKQNPKEESISYDKIKTGFIIILSLYVVSAFLRHLTLISTNSLLKLFTTFDITHLFPPVIVFLVLLIFLLRFFNLIPSYYIERANQASKFVTTTFSDAILVLVGTKLDFKILIDNFQNISFIITCLLCVITTASTAAIIGNLIGYYPVQSSIAAGLCANSIGGAGNIAILEAADSKKLMPYAQISTRIGGDIVVIVTSIIFPIVYTFAS
ncbi:malate/citrate symporter [Candidatus Phytoplasma luffae]|uniref:Malate/citrate symporter n=1 Tax=Loofah witches'-broom phytoplasma TaxID=35773 RepID=A0A975FJ03_LOWBP|nr:2-hydroxycarboxylate transporter family protein [Candidatus Phytoplasma luffae]QTX02697.1 malate/citrate symporter [Candidatus Phytoplasma luffae]